MTIASKLETINEALGDIKSSIVAKGVTPTGDITTYSTAIESISTGDEITATNTTGSAVSADDKVWVEPEINYTQNFSVGGNPAINNFTLTSTDYPNRSGIVYNMINPPVPQESVEVQLKGYINYNTSANYPNASTGYGDFSIYCKAPGSGGYPYESALSLFLGDGLTIKTNKGANKYTILPRTSLVKDQMYWFKVLVTGSQIVASYSTDGSSWIDTTLSVSGLLAAFTNTYIGMSTATSEGYGTYDLLECYVKVDGNTVWTPYLASTTYSIINDTDITSTSFTGIAQANIANNATGSVKTLLDGNGTYAPTTATKSITTNGTYTASAENAYGLSSVTVNVPIPDVWHNWKSDATANTNLTTYQSLGDRGSRIAYGNGTYVVISSQDNYFSYSTDNGQTWTRSKTSTGTMRLWNGLVYGNGKFVAVTGTYAGDYNIGAVSSDGINWTEVTLSASKQWNDIAYGNGKFVAVASFGSNNICTTSSDGVTWTSHTLPRNAYWWSIIFDGTQFITIGTSGGSTYIATSSDGDTWAEKSSIASSCYTICYGNNKYIVSGGPTSFVSLDLENWTSYSTGSTSSWYFSAYGNGYYIGIPQDQYYSANPTKAYLSSDGEQWTEITLSSGYHWCDVIYENDKFTICSTGGVADLTISQSQCYTLTASPTTSTQVYEIPKKTSTLTITSVGTDTITLSDSKVYNRNSAGDVESPVLGTKTITSNDTYTAASDYLDGFSSVTVDVPSAPTKKYNLLDRVKDDNNNEIGTVSGFFTDANNVEYAVVCLDAQYRTDNGNYISPAVTISGIPVYNNGSVYSAPETSTENTTAILAQGSSSGCSHCRSKSFIINGITYYGQLPNLVELIDIIKHYTEINQGDISVGTKISLSKSYLSSTQSNSTNYWYYGNTGIFNMNGAKYEVCYIAPVLEIPNT